MSQQTIVQNGNKGGGEMGNKGKEKKVHSYIEVMTKNLQEAWAGWFQRGRPNKCLSSCGSVLSSRMCQW